MAPQSTEKRPKGAGTKAVYETLRTQILSLELAPGSLLDETTLAERFNLSRSPIREALIRLASDELVVALANRSTIVAPIDIAAFPRYVEALDTAQRVVARLAAENRTAADLKRMAGLQRTFKDTLKGGNHLEMSKANMDFHMAIAQAARNPYMCSFYERLLTQGRRMLHMHFSYLENGVNGYLLTDRNDDMCAAIERRDADLADRLAHEHTCRFQEHFIQFMKDNYLADAPLALDSRWAGSARGVQRRSGSPSLPRPERFERD